MTDQLDVLFNLAEVRANDREPCEQITRQIVDTFYEILQRADECQQTDECQQVARSIMAGLSAQVCREAAAALHQVHSDPAAPALEKTCNELLTELSMLAAIFVSVGTDGQVPDPANESAGEYRAVNTLIAQLMSAVGGGQPAWGLLR